MRKLNYLLIALTIFISACENGFHDEDKNQISLSTKTIEVDFESDEHAIKVTSPYSWIAESKNDWISLTCDNGIAGTEELKFVCDRNLEESERKGTIVIKNEDFGLATELYVTQKSFIPELVVEQDKTLSFTEKGGSEIIKVSSNFNYSVSDNASWISCYKVEEGVKVTASASDVVNERTAQVTIYSEKYNLSYDIRVSQGAFEPYLNIYTSELNFNSENSTQYVSVSTNASFGVSSNSNWLYCTTEDGKVKITAYKNTTTEERIANVRVYLQEYNLEATIKVTQEAFIPEWCVVPETLTFRANGGTREIAITANFDYTYSANADWISLKRTSNGISVIVSNHIDIDERADEIFISSKKYGITKIVSVKQEAFVPILEIEDVLTIECDYKGGEKVIAVTANFDYDVTTTADWVTYNKSNSGINIIVHQNYIMEISTAEIKIFSERYNLSGNTITITRTESPLQIGTIITKNGVKGVVFDIDDTTTKMVSITETSADWYDAKTWCSNYGTGWYLPTTYEWKMIAKNRSTINSALSANGYTTLTHDYVYWSSTELYNDYDYAYIHDFSSGGYGNGYQRKSYSSYVRAVLVFEN